MKTITIIVEQTGTGYSAYVHGLKNGGIVTTGKTFRSTMKHLTEAMELWEKKDEIISKPTRKNPFGYKPGVKRLPVRNKVIKTTKLK